MKKPILVGLALIPPLLLGGLALAQSAGVNSLRGAEVDEPAVLDQVHRTVEGRMQRNYRQQPPLIPHSIEQYQIDLRTNQCLSCHDWTKAGERNAPTLSMTHYLDREGRELDQIAGTRYFCNQCHVPQADALPLVDNTFEPSSGN
ncbi:nitrate reductase cytochrome c-type subunit [Ruegeria sp. SCSIO 43209]|jgi:cytochrome c-type protein NapB|uniref:nitrate reductase cytochrome c-type subunit n=1 Tax=Ruegeria TaxID=97050 RepID=UPI00147FE9D8|nr:MULTISPECIES: nitrate reductase cytochrome c-type subunit [Ruegeria]UAB88898.1 nitrate reductase cytochrome c-type subunit [Ruegeria sp. SCSIO 43209]UWR02827.1 nitrate reductase cytochrome c-type subunit [Ruegeria conchae]